MKRKKVPVLSNFSEEENLRIEQERSAASSRGVQFAVDLEPFPAINAGAPLPHVVSNESATAVVFHSSRGGEDRGVAWALFRGVASFSLGSPNDETLSGHPLYGSGLRFYAAHEVINSVAIKQLETLNRVHPRHNPSRFESLRHFVLAFHDSTFECICADFEVGKSTDAKFDDVLRTALTALKGRAWPETANRSPRAESNC